MIDYISKLNIVASEYLAKAGMPRVACVTCQVPLMSGSATGAIFKKPLSVRVLPTGSTCNPGANGVVHSQSNPYIGASGTYVSVVNVPYSTGCDFATCVTNPGAGGNLQRSQSYAISQIRPCSFTSTTTVQIPNLVGVAGSGI